jgi:hypothetical protein
MLRPWSRGFRGCEISDGWLVVLSEVIGTSGKPFDMKAYRQQFSNKERNMKFYGYVTIGIVLCLTSCQDTSTPTTVLDILHSPVTTNVTNNFTFSIDANQYSDNSNNILSFLSDSLVVTLSSTSYSSGQAIISVSDSSYATIFTDTVRSNKTIAIAHLKTTKPRHCSLNITNLTAKLAFVVMGQ